MKSIPLYVYPTTVVCIDDQASFLEALQLDLPAHQHYYRFYDNATTALDALTKELNHFQPNAFISNEEANHFQQHQMNIDFYSIPHLAYHPHRFNDIACLVVDYHMPGLGGLELCEKIANPNVQKILLTGIADEQVAINAFNHGLINQFIPKSDPNMMGRLVDAITKAQQDYFRIITKPSLEVILHDHSRPTLLREPDFPDFFQTLCKQYNIREYYLFETIGCFVLIDHQGKLYGFFASTETEMKDMVEEAQETPGIHPSIVTKLANHLFCYHQDSLPLTYPPLADREPYLRPATLFQGTFDRYYWALTDDILQLDASRIHLLQPNGKTNTLL